MAIYSVRCSACGSKQDVVLTMDAAIAGHYPPCEACAAPVVRIYTVPNEVGTENVFRPYWSENLTQDDGKVYVPTRADESYLMGKFGCRHQESGETEAFKQDRKRKRRESTERLHRACDQAFERAVRDHGVQPA